MAVSNTTLFTPRCVWPTLILLWILLWEAGCDTQYQAEEGECFTFNYFIQMYNRIFNLCGTLHWLSESGSFSNCCLSAHPKPKS